ncbi:Hint domain-containing protein [Methylobacterium sp. J-068]|uniref:Hint domain-containing protein n=1 Tax=Methylobacterium sp. J-068 TaxID=2836649 RepID=UPI001FBAA97E|nr:Hint domain-containing protein [Methylobacterium sp. J-068]MCJ2033265.1 Hint domain-containing protein [Methylobacterium sp. J-068]
MSGVAWQDTTMATTRVSTAADGTEGNANSSTAASGSQISANGRYVVFASSATNLVGGDANGRTDIFVKDLFTGTVTLVSVASDGTQASANSSAPSISADGTRVSFTSSATNLVADDTNNASDVFVRDLTTNTTTRVSVASDGSQGTASSNSASISADGTHVVFASNAANLVAGDTNGTTDVFVRDLTNSTTTRVNVASDGSQATGGASANSSISADGTRVAFASNANNLVTGDTNNATDVFVRDLTAGTTTRVSVSTGGAQSTGGSSSAPSISADGTRVAFASTATNLVGGDTNSASDIFVRDLTANTTTRVSVATDGTPTTSGDSSNASISADGTRVAFQSTATNLVSRDTNGSSDIFVRNLTSNTTTRVSIANDGSQATSSSTAPSISGNGARVAFTSFANNLVADDTNDSNDVFVADVVCYVAGTAIRITRDESARDVPVEELTVGDLALTASGETRPIRWLGHRTIDCTRHSEPRKVWPVRIAAHAFGPGKPARDLLVSPAHAICVDLMGEVLIPAIRLVNGTTITQVAVEHVTYWHVELDGHDILLAENLPAESYLDCGNRRFFASEGVTDFAALPDVRPEGPLPFCRPFYEEGAVVDFARARLEECAKGLGWRLVEETFAGLHVVADGRIIRPRVRGLTARFVLPEDVRDVRLVSATSVSAYVLPGSSDDRNLGVSLASITLDDGLTGAREIALDDARLAQGFHAMDENSATRWTDGAAVLPADLWAGCEDLIFLRVTLSGPALPRWIGPNETASVVALDAYRQRG